MKYVGLVLSGLLRKKLRTTLTLLSLIAAFTLLGLLQAVNSLFGGAADFLGANRLISQASTSFTQPLPMRLLTDEFLDLTTGALVAEIRGRAQRLRRQSSKGEVCERDRRRGVANPVPYSGRPA